MTLKQSILTGSILLVSALPSHADSEINTLIQMLHENGMVSDEQYVRLQAELTQNQTQVLKEKEAMQKQLHEATKPSEVEVKVKDGLVFKTRDGAFSTKIGARVMADAAWYDNDNDTMGDGTNIRRARMSIQGKMYSDWGYKFEYDFAGDHNKGIKDAFVSYNGLDAVSFKAGNMKDPFSLQDQMNANYNLFNERSLTDAFSVVRHIGVMAFTDRKNWTAATGLFGEAVQTVGQTNDEGWGLATRVTLAPVNKKGALLHFAAAVSYRDAGDAATLRFKQQPESTVAGINIVDTGSMTNVDDHIKYGLEFAMVSGPLSVQSEYVTTTVNRQIAPDLNFDSWYLQTGYFLTGESRRYSKGKFVKIVPNSSVGEGGIGAWELGLRYSTIDLNDQGLSGGEADNFTLGVNWYATPAIKFSANYINVLDIKGGPAETVQPNIVQVRSQWAF
jgi:phosphate-selective porin OprO/OprP